MRLFITHSIDPVYFSDSKVLILGTMPSIKSREFGFYYSHPQNRFFKVLAHIFSRPVPVTKLEKIDFLKANKIALWDVLKSCEIKNSQDSSIKNPVANDINLVLQNADIKAVFTTGRKSTSLYKKLCFPSTKVPSIYLPSTSPANCARYSFDDLALSYKIILKYL